ncbi:hypothetical protein [Micromonospora sp. NPDC002575]|uniref:hypothetical protein n=1 Tax=Micromonospora sp. NPDC002575 TaxID=3364222 RepID=UPI003679BE6C
MSDCRLERAEPSERLPQRSLLRHRQPPHMRPPHVEAQHPRQLPDGEVFVQVALYRAMRSLHSEGVNVEGVDIPTARRCLGTPNPRQGGSL